MSVAKQSALNKRMETDSLLKSCYWRNKQLH